MLAACQGFQALPKPAEGYRALRITQTQAFPIPIGTIIVPAGRVYVEDRFWPGRPPIWCPDTTPEDCVRWDGRALTLGATQMVERGPFVLPAGSFQEFRLR